MRPSVRRGIPRGIAGAVPASTALLLLAVVVTLPTGPQAASVGAPRDAGVGTETSPPSDVVTVTLGFATKDHTIGAPLYALVTWNFAATPGSGTWTVSNCQTQAAGTTLNLFALGNGVGPGMVNVTNSRCLVAQPPGMQDLWLTGGSDQYANVSAPVFNASVTVSGTQAAVFSMALVPVGVPTAADVATVHPLYSGLTTVSVGPVGCRNASDPNEGAKGCISVLGANDGSEYFRSYAVASWGSLPPGATAAHAIAFHALCSQVPTIEQDGISVPPSSPTGPAGTTVFDAPAGVTAWNASNALNAGREYCIAVEATLANGTVQWSNLVPVVPVDTQAVGQFSGNQQFAGPFDVNTASPSAGMYVANFGCENMPCRMAWGNLSLVSVSNVTYGMAWATLGVSYLGSVASSQYVDAGGRYPQAVEVWAGPNCISGYEGTYPWNTTSATITVPLTDWWGGQTVLPGAGWSAAIVSQWSLSPYGFASACVPIYVPQAPGGSGPGPVFCVCGTVPSEIEAFAVSPLGIGFWFVLGVLALATGAHRISRSGRRNSGGD